MVSWVVNIAQDSSVILSTGHWSSTTPLPFPTFISSSHDSVIWRRKQTQWDLFPWQGVNFQEVNKRKLHVARRIHFPMSKAYADCCRLRSVHTAKPSCEMIRTFSSQERDGCGITISAWSQYFVISVAKKVSLHWGTNIAAVKHYAAQRWRNWPH